MDKATCGASEDTIRTFRLLVVADLKTPKGGCKFCYQWGLQNQHPQSLEHRNLNFNGLIKFLKYCSVVSFKFQGKVQFVFLFIIGLDYPTQSQ